MVIPAALSRPARLLGRLAVPLVGALATLAMAALFLLRPGLATRLDLRIYDHLLPLRASPRPSAVPVIIDIDEASLAAYGQWPWPRYRVADLLDSLAFYGLAAVGIDVLFPEPDRSSPDRMREELLRDRDVTVDFPGLPDELRDYDRLLARAIGRAPVVLGAYVDYREAGPAAPGPPPSVGIAERLGPGAVPALDGLPDAGRVLASLPAFLDAAPVGFVNAIPDQDGLVRQIPLVVRAGDGVFPSLALRSLMLAAGLDTLDLVSGPEGLRSVGLGGLSVPVSPQGFMLVPFAGPRGTYPYHSAAKVLERSVPREELGGRIAFVGTSAMGLSDIHAMPLDPSYPGVEIHAAVVDAILAGNAIVSPAWAPALQMAAILLSGLLSTVAFGLARPRLYIPAGVALVAGAVLASRALFARGLFVSPLYAAMTVCLAGSLLALARFQREEGRRLAIREAFSRYVGPEVAGRITGDRESLLGGQERELSIMFSDIRGFTSISENLRPREVVALLNGCFSAMTALVRASRGTLDKFIGDALMAYWNAPLDVPGHPLRAVGTALAMQEAIPGVNGRLRASLGLEIRIGIGLHTGLAFVGDMGSRDLVNYTIIGDNVNLASRLEGLCGRYGAGIVVSAETMRGCGDAFAFRFIDSIRVKGRLRPVSAFEPMRLGEAGERGAELLAWEEAAGLYRRGEFGLAAEALSALHGDHPGTRLYAVYLERALSLQENPPDDWDGVWTATDK
jgi:adenylate cyclase